MASSAALMQAGLSFESSTLDRSTNPDNTAAGLTFGSVADSFHSEDYDQGQQWQHSAAGGGAPESCQAGFDSLLDEQEMSEPESPPQHRPQPATRHVSSRQAGGSRTTGGTSSQASSRLASNTTDATSVASPGGSMGPPPPRRNVKSAVLDLGGDRSLAGESSVGPGEASGLLRNINRDDQSERGESVAGGTRRDKSGEKLGQNMTLREQEKVSSIPNLARRYSPAAPRFLR